MAFARSSLGGALDVIPVIPPCVWTSTEIDFRRISSAAEVVAAVWAASVEPRGAAPPLSIAPTELVAGLPIHGGGASACPKPQQSMTVLPRRREVVPAWLQCPIEPPDAPRFNPASGATLVCVVRRARAAPLRPL